MLYDTNSFSTMCLAKGPRIARYVKFNGKSFDFLILEGQLYERTAKTLVKAFFDDAKVTCFAYGQTGSGKSHSKNVIMKYVSIRQ